MITQVIIFIVLLLICIICKGIALIINDEKIGICNIVIIPLMVASLLFIFGQTLLIKIPKVIEKQEANYIKYSTFDPDVPIGTQVIKSLNSDREFDDFSKNALEAGYKVILIEKTFLGPTKAVFEKIK
jgi:hypothetical protein